MIKTTVKRNGATRRIDMAREFIMQRPDRFNLYLSDMIATLRSYERDGQFIVTDETLTIIHYC